jgi:type I restriction enzyme R subunit
LQSEGVEEVAQVNANTKDIDLLSEDYMARLEKLKLPNTKVKLMEKLLRTVITDFKKVNKMKGVDFTKRLNALVERYNDRSDNAVFAQEVLDEVAKQMAALLKEVNKEKKSFKDLGITYEEKAFYDILKEIAHKFGFEYPEDKLLKLAAAVKKMVDDKSKYTDWANRADIKAELQMDLILILAEHGYPPVPQDDVFKEIFEQAENFKKYESQDEENTIKETPVISMYPYLEEEDRMMMVADDIYIYGSIPVDLPNTKRNDLIDKKLDLILMYAIGSSARQKTESSGKIALGIKEDLMKDEQMAAYKSIRYLLFHYWSKPKAYLLTKEPILVDKKSVPTDYLLRQDKGAVKFLLLDYNPQQSAELGAINVLKTQRRGEIRYLPFVTTIDSIIDE